jgi:mono/diheme cytochrome c family protein
MAIGKERVRKGRAARLRRATLAVGMLLFLAFVAAVGPAEARGEEEPVSAAASAEAKEIYRSRCTLCHGELGKGDGPGAAAFDPRPRDLSGRAWQESVSDAYIEKIIVAGGVAVGKSPMMPANPDLKSKPEVVAALRLVVRGLEKEP